MSNTNVFKVIRRRRIGIFHCNSCFCIAEYIGDYQPNNSELVVLGDDHWYRYDCPNCGEHAMYFGNSRLEEIADEQQILG